MNTFEIQKNKSIKKVLLISILLFLQACSVVDNRTKHQQLIKYVEDQKYGLAIKIATDKNWYKDEKDRLVKLMEAGITYYYAGAYKHALETLNEAHDLSVSLYTKSILSGIASTFKDDNSLEFTGFRYEQSQIRLYQALIHLSIYLNGKIEGFYIDKYKHKLIMASEEEVKKFRENKEKEYAKNKSFQEKKKEMDGDLSDNIYTRSELEKFVKDGLATKIPPKTFTEKERKFHYRSALNIMREWYSIFNQFKLETSDKATFKADLMENILGGMLFEQTGSSADRQIALGLYKEAKERLFMYYNMYPSFNEKYQEFVDNYSKFKDMTDKEIKEKFVKPTFLADEMMTFIDEKISELKDDKKDNFYLIVQTGRVNEKQAKKEPLKVPLPYGMVLDFKYERPFVDCQPTPIIVAKLENRIITKKDKNKKQPDPLPMVLATPMNDISCLDLTYSSHKEAKNLETKLITKYLSIAGATYASSLVLGALLSAGDVSNADSFAKAATLLTLAASKESIEQNNLADLRQWKLLPSSVYVGTSKLKKGDYKLHIYKSINGKQVSEKIVNVRIPEDGQDKMMSVKID